MQPVKYRLLLSQAAKFDVIVTPESQMGAFGWTLAVISLDPPTPDEEDVANIDFASLRPRPNVYALLSATFEQVLVRYAASVVWIKIETLGVRIRAEIQKHTAASDAALSPVVDGAF